MAFIYLYTGGAEATKASYVNGCHRQRHLWNLLGRRLSNTRIGGYCLIQARSSCYSLRSHHGYVQFRCQSVCLCFDKPTIQGEDEGNDMLWSNFISTKGSCCGGTAGHQNDRQRRTTFHMDHVQRSPWCEWTGHWASRWKSFLPSKHKGYTPKGYVQSSYPSDFSSPSHSSVWQLCVVIS